MYFDRFMTTLNSCKTGVPVFEAPKIAINFEPATDKKEMILNVCKDRADKYKLNIEFDDII